MNRIKLFLCSLAFVGGSGFFLTAAGQSDQQLLAQLLADDETTIQALVLYPPETRQAIFEATQYPEALIKLEAMQAQTSQSFRALLENYPQGTQEKIWDMTRFPNLVPDLVAAGPGHSAKVKKLLTAYPETIRERAAWAARDHFAELARIEQLNQTADAAFRALLEGYPAPAQAAFHQLLELPEVLSILTENIRLTVLLGDLYRRDPVWISRQADSLSLVVARQNAQELEDWKSRLENNPEALAQLETAAQTFADEYVYDDEFYDYPDDDLYYDEQRVAVHHFFDYHYPYWFGYPSWYYHPRWRVYPYWYEWGFYFGPGQQVIVVGLPSYYFVNWYFYNPYHHSQWPVLSAHFTNHYYGHRQFPSSISSGVGEWRARNREVVSEDWLRSDGRLPERFREFGKFEADRAKYNQAHREKPMTQAEFVEKNSRRYPTLAQASSRPAPEAKEEQEPRTVRPETPPRDLGKTAPPQPRTKPQREVPKTVPRTEPNRDAPKTQPRTRTEPVPRPTVPKVKTGVEMHRDTWERSQPAPQPKVRTAPPKTTTPRSTAPKTKKGNTSKKN